MTKILLIAMALVEAAVGAALLVAPSFVAMLLLGVTLETASGQVVARIAGAALLALGVVCWLARTDHAGRAARGAVVGMLIYNGAAVAVLGYAGAGRGLHGPLLWPAVLAHAALAVWCLASLRPRGAP